MSVKGFGIGRTLPMPISEIRAASSAGGGTALTTTAARVTLPDKTEGVQLITRNYSTAVVVGWAPCPYLVVLKTIDDLATATDYSNAAQDADASDDVDLSSLDTLANGDYVLVGSHVPFRGLAVDVDAANGNVSVLTVKYWSGSAWVDISASDGTVSAGKTFAQDGNITWTVPSAWTKARLKEAIAACATAVGPMQDLPLYWLRLEVSAALDSATGCNAIISMPRSTAYAELTTGLVQELSCQKGPGGIAAVEALTDAGTANLIVNALTFGENGF